MKSGATKLFEGDFDFNIPALKPAVAYAVDGETGTLKVSQGSVSGNYQNSWRLSLDETTPVDLHVTLGAGDAQLVLGRLNLQSLTIRLGAGDLVLDLRGTPATSYSVSVEAGAGDTTIQLPASVGISARTSGLIGDANVSGLPYSVRSRFNVLFCCSIALLRAGRCVRPPLRNTGRSSHAHQQHSNRHRLTAGHTHRRFRGRRARTEAVGTLACAGRGP